MDETDRDRQRQTDGTTTIGGNGFGGLISFPAAILVLGVGRINVLWAPPTDNSSFHVPLDELLASL
jgi:hypothetical protein